MERARTEHSAHTPFKRPSLLELPDNVLLAVGSIARSQRWQACSGQSQQGVWGVEAASSPVEYSLLDEADEGWVAVYGLAGVCKRLRRLLSPILWHRVKILDSMDTGIERTLRGVQRHHVQSVVFHTVDPQKVEHYMGLFPSARTVSLYPLEHGQGPRPPVQSTRLLEIVRIIARAAASRIERVLLGGHFAYGEEVYRSLHPLQIADLGLFEKLHTLHFETLVIPAAEGDEKAAFHASEELYGRLVVASQCKSLKNLFLAVGEASWPAPEQLSALSWLGPVEYVCIDFYTQREATSSHLWTFLDLLRKSLLVLEIKGPGRLPPMHGVTFPKLAYIILTGASWASMLDCEWMLYRPLLLILELHDSHFLFDDDAALHDGINYLYQRYLRCLRRTRHMVKKQLGALQRVRIDIHWPHRAGFDHAVLEEVKEDFDAMVGALCRNNGIKCQFTVHP